MEKVTRAAVWRIFQNAILHAGYRLGHKPSSKIGCEQQHRVGGDFVRPLQVDAGRDLVIDFLRATAAFVGEN
jgi:hypothetical protein